MERLTDSSGRILGLDYGDRTVGVAVSDPSFITAQGVEVIRRERPTKLRKTLAEIGRLIEEYQVGGIVVGLPLLLDGSEGERCRATREFASKLTNRFSLPVEFLDERMTTVQAERVLDEEGLSLERKKSIVDEAAAVLILQAYLDKQ